MPFDFQMPGKEKKKMGEPIKFSSTISQVRTLVDGGFKVSFDVPEVELAAVMALMAFRGVVVDVQLLPQKGI